MPDAAVVAICAQCLARAASCNLDERDVALVATALARDLTETQGADAQELLGAAARTAAGWLDASELDADSFVAASRSLAKIQELTDTRLRGGAMCEPRWA